MSIYDVKCPVFLEDGGINVTSPFGWRIHPVSKVGEGHKGVDITRWVGYSNLATITALASGIVTAVKDTVPWIDVSNAANSAGNYVVIDHGGGYVTKYFHLKYNSVAVAVGDIVEAGTVIGYMGTTGNSTGAHLHFQIEKDGVPVDGLPYLLGEEYINVKTEESTMNENMNELDNTPNEWAEEAVAWATENGIMYGDEHGNLKLHDNATREHMIVFLHRLYEKIKSEI